jgi:hypothetical protein
MDWLSVDILAADLDGIIEILIFIVFLVIAVVSAIAKKVQEKNQQSGPPPRRGRRPPQHRHPQQMQGPGGIGQPQRRQAAAQSRPSPYAPEEQPIRLEPAAPPQPAKPAKKKQPSMTAVEQEIDRLQSRLRKLEDYRSRRLKTRTSGRLSAAGIERRLKLSHEAVAAAEEGASLPELRDRDMAARAIIYAEVLGPPKALQESLEPWDG